MPDTIAGEAILQAPASREGRVFITANAVYKVFSKDRLTDKSGAKSYDFYEKYKIAEAAGLPLPQTGKFTAPLCIGSSSEMVEGLRMSKAHGRFWQLSKGGGPAALMNEIFLCKDKAKVGQIIAALEAAGRLGVSDPQGFIDINGDPPLVFIDLHQDRNPNPGRFEDILVFARKHLAELG